MKPSISKSLYFKVMCIVLICALCVSASFFLFFIYAEYRIKKVDFSRFVAKTQRTSTTVTLYGRSNETISARFGFYTLDGDLVYAMERSWQGWELILDYKLIKTSSGFLVFPYTIYTDVNKNSKGLKIVSNYERHKVPYNYYFSDITKKEEKDLKFLFFLTKFDSLFPILKSISTKSFYIRSFDAGTMYSLVVYKDGSLSLQE